MVFHVSGTTPAMDEERFWVWQTIFGSFTFSATKTVSVGGISAFLLQHSGEPNGPKHDIDDYCVLACLYKAAICIHLI